MCYSASETSEQQHSFAMIAIRERPEYLGLEFCLACEWVNV